MSLFHRNVCTRGSPKLRRLTQLTVFVSALFLAASAHAADYYVATNGSDSNPGTQAAPFKTLAKAVSAVRGGETVYFGAGAYAATTIKNLNPPAGQWITFKPLDGKATINTAVSASTQGSLMIIDSSYLIFDGFEITDLDYKYNLPACDFTKTSCSSPDSRVGIDIRSSGDFPTKTHHLIFRNNDIHNNGVHGIMGGAADVQLLNNRIHNNGYPAVGREGYGTYIEGERWLVRGNDIYQNNGDNLRLANTTKPEYYAVDWIIEQNIIRDQLGPFSHPSGVERTPTPSDGLNVALYGMDGGIFRNNIVYNGYGNGVWSRNMAGTTLIYNNTIYGNGNYGLLLSGTSIAKNNIIYKNAQRASNSELLVTGNSTASNNIVGGSPLLIYLDGAGKESGNFRNVDPQFTNPGSGDFHLQPGSPAIDKGLTLSEVPGDYFGGARPFGAAYDIGAIEQGSTPGTVAPAPPPASSLPSGGIGAGAGGTGTGTGGGISNCAR